MDGQSLLSLLTEGRKGRRRRKKRRKTETLIEYHGESSTSARKDCPGYGWVGEEEGVFLLHRGPKDFKTPPFYANQSRYTSLPPTHLSTHPPTHRSTNPLTFLSIYNSQTWPLSTHPPTHPPTAPAPVLS